MELNEHKKALEKVLTDLSKDFGEPFIGKLIALTVANMKTTYNEPNHTLCDIIKACMLEIDTSKTQSEIIQISGYADRLIKIISSNQNESKNQ